MVLFLDVLCERCAVAIELESLARADEALRLHRLLRLLLLVTKLRERVDDDTEDHVQTDDGDQNEEAIAR